MAVRAPRRTTVRKLGGVVEPMGGHDRALGGRAMLMGGGGGDLNLDDALDLKTLSISPVRGLLGGPELVHPTFGLTPGVDPGGGAAGDAGSPGSAPGDPGDSSGGPSDGGAAPGDAAPDAGGGVSGAF